MNELVLVDGLTLPRSAVYELETKMKDLNLPDTTNTEHFFSPGIYTRILHIPKGCLLTGKIHKEPILNIMVKGEISVLLGGETVRIKAPMRTWSASMPTFIAAVADTADKASFPDPAWM